jgi:hypothetical protein
MTIRFFITFFLLLSFCSTFMVQQTKAQYVQKNVVFTVGQPITFSGVDADTLIVTYRPGSNISHAEYIPLTNGSYTWIPESAGIISLSTPGGPSQTISVRFETLPLSGLIMLIVAGSILFGGAIAASIRLFGKESPEMVARRTDT